MGIKWRPVLWATVLIFVLNFVVGFALGVVGMIAFAFVGDERGKSLLSSPIALIQLWLIGLIPVSVGTAELVKSIDADHLRHCFILVGLNVALMIVFLPLMEEDFGWMEFIQTSLLMLVASTLTCLWVQRSR